MFAFAKVREVDFLADMTVEAQTAGGSVIDGLVGNSCVAQMGWQS